MSSQKKIISINPAFLSVHSRTSTRSKKKNLQDKRVQINQYKMSMKPNRIKKDLLHRIKEYQKKYKDQQEQEKQSHLQKEKIQFHSEFQEAVKSLEHIAKRKQRSHTLRKKQYQKKVSKQHLPPSIHIQSSTPQIRPQLVASHTIPHSVGSYNNKPDPPYGCLKGGNKQTYRQYKQTLKHTLKNQIPLVIEDKPTISSDAHIVKRQENLHALRTKMNVVMPARHVPQKRKRKIHTIKRIYHLGKRGRKVNVLIKNKKTRKLVEKAVKSLERTSLIEVKRYLKKKHLLKTGSTAPEYMLRVMYMNAMLAGDVHNKNANILVHNYFNKE